MFRSIVRTDVANKTVASSSNQLSQTHSLPMVATRVRSKGREKSCRRRETRKERTKKTRKLTKKHNKEEKNETKDGKDSPSRHINRKGERVVMIQEKRKSWMIIDRIQMKRKAEKVVMIQEKRKSWMITDRIQMKRKSSQATQMTFAVKSSYKMWVNKVGGNQ